MQEWTAASGVLSPNGNHHVEQMLVLFAINRVMGNVAG